MIMLFLCLQITAADISPQVKWAVKPVIADDHFKEGQIEVAESQVADSRYK